MIINVIFKNIKMYESENQLELNVIATKFKVIN